MRYIVSMRITIDALDEHDALAQAKKLGDLAKTALFRMSIASEGVKLANGGEPLVYYPQRDGV